MGALDQRTGGSPVELAFSVRDRDCFFVDASVAASCRVELEHFVRRSDGRFLDYFLVDGAAPEAVQSLADERPSISDVRLVNRSVDGGLLEFVSAGPCVATTLADAGAVTQSVAAENGEGRVVATVPDHARVRDVVETFQDRHDATLRSRRDAERSAHVRTAGGAQAALTDALTEKQVEVLGTAYRNGYFEWPRESTAAECAAALGIAQPTFSQHVRTAQRNLLGGIFDEGAREG